LFVISLSRLPGIVTLVGVGVSEARVRVKAKDRAHAMHSAICAAEIRRRVLRFRVLIGSS
jgi:hypothetical protein